MGFILPNSDLWGGMVCFSFTGKIRQIADPELMSVQALQTVADVFFFKLPVHCPVLLCLLPSTFIITSLCALGFSAFKAP